MQHAAIRWGLDVRASTFFARHCRRDVLTSLHLRLIHIQRGPVCCVRLAYLSYKNNGTSQEATMPADRSIKRIKPDSPPSVITTGPGWKVQHQVTAQQHRRLRPMKAVSGHPSFHFHFHPSSIAYTTTTLSDPPRWQLSVTINCMALLQYFCFWIAHPGRIDSAWHLCCARKIASNPPTVYDVSFS